MLAFIAFRPRLCRSIPPSRKNLHWRALVILLLVPGDITAQGGVRVENITWVSATGTAAANCQTLRDFLASLPTSSAFPNVVQLEPGFYDCGTTTVQVPGLTTLEGAGQRTVIFGSIDNPSQGIVTLGLGAHLSNVLVWNTKTTPALGAIAIAISGPSASNTLTDVTALVSVSTTAAGSGHPLYVRLDTNDVTVDGGSFTGGKIFVRTDDPTPFTSSFTLFHALVEGVDASSEVTARCYFYRLPGGLGDVGNTCPP